MNHKNMMLLGLLMCLSVGTLAQESNISPWQTLNSAMSDAPKAEAESTHEFSDVPYDVTYPEADYQNDTDYMSDEELILQSLPFKLPFKMDKKQLQVSMKILKAAIKPILKSKELREVVAYIDESLKSYKADLETQMYVTLLLDSMQEIYEGKETAELNMMAKRIVTDMSDEETARTMTTAWRSIYPYIDDYVLDPMRNYVVSPVRSYLYDPITNYVTDFAERIETWMESSQRPYVDIRYPENNYYRRWSERMNDYASRISDWASQARQGLTMARRMIEIQEEGRCYSCGDDEHHDVAEHELYNVK